MFNLPVKTLKPKKHWGSWIFYLFITSGIASAIISFTLHKWSQPNLPPTAKIIISSPAGIIPHTVMLDASSSFDPEGKKLSYQWSLNEIPISDKPYFNYVIKNTGTTRVELAVTDIKGLTSKTSTFVTTTQPHRVYTVKEALKFYTYQMGWLGPLTEQPKFYPLQLLTANDHFVKLQYTYKQGKIYGVVSEFQHKVLGVWEDDDGEGIFELTFDKDFKTASGWWRYDYSDKKYEMILNKIE